MTLQTKALKAAVCEQGESFSRHQRIFLSLSISVAGFLCVLGMGL